MAYFVTEMCKPLARIDLGVSTKVLTNGNVKAVGVSAPRAQTSLSSVLFGPNTKTT
jgi:hypothetical protein